MQKPKHTLFAAGAYLALVGTIVITTSSPGGSQGHGNGQPPGPDVRVINKTSEPVPVSLQGTGKITGDVTVVNSPTVKLEPGSLIGIDPAGSSVTISNDASDPIPVTGTFRNVDEPARNPHQDSTGQLVASSSFTTDGPLSSVPAGKQLVMEYFSATAIVPSGQSGYFFIETRAGGITAFHHVPVIQKFADGAFAGSDLLLAAQSLRIYADPGTIPSLNFRRSSSVGSSSFSADISGYLVNL